MKKNVFIFLGIALFTIVVLTSGSQIKNSGVKSNVLKTNDSFKEFNACPSSPTTIQGCIVEVDGCFFVNTINGRTIAIGIFGQPVGTGDKVTLTGNWVTDADCAPCLLNATNVTDLGGCN